jgi:hypothetical protein
MQIIDTFVWHERVSKPFPAIPHVDLALMQLFADDLNWVSLEQILLFPPILFLKTFSSISLGKTFQPLIQTYCKDV